MDWNDPKGLIHLDQTGYKVFDAVTTASLHVNPTFSRPNAFVCIDGKTYWVKGKAQQGLVAELIAGRLASLVGAGPRAEVIRVMPEILPPDGSLNHLAGVVVGSLDQVGSVNSRELSPLLAGGEFRANAVDPQSRARTTVFHTWLGMSDAQVLISLTDGKVMSIDHGDCFGILEDPAGKPVVIRVDIPGVDQNVGREERYVLPAVDRIEAVTESDMLEAVARIPAGGQWRSSAERRLAIGRWLIQRQQQVRGVMSAWMMK